ncbi:MAG: DUF748 domain-containing protein [Deltaproteobacteria bacterium]|nr:DUF748 domain-containing protein [Deltaproteobacteria bacterium]
MGTIKTRLRLIKWYQWVLASSLFLYLVYLCLSWFYLPGKLKNTLETDVSTLIGREITTGDIRFNPFKLSLQIENLSVSDSNDGHLAAWDNLLVDFGLWKSVFLFGIAFDELSLDNSRINIIKFKTGFNFSDIVEKLSSGSGKEKEDKKGKRPIAIKLFNTSINKGAFKYPDKSGDDPATVNLNDISIKVNELYFATGDEHLNPFTINAKDQEGGELQLKGDYRIDPLYVEGSIGANNINLEGFSKFLENILPLKIGKGMLSFDTNIHIKDDTDFIFKIDKGNLAIKDLGINDNFTDPAMLSAGNIAIQNFTVDITMRRVLVEDVLLDRLALNQWIDKKGKARYEALVAPDKPAKTGQENASADNGKENKPWDIMVRQVFLKNSTIDFEDQNEKINTKHTLSGINLDLKDISLAPESKISINLAAILNSNGEINIEGFLCPTPFSMELKYKLDKLMLNPFTKYLEAIMWLNIADGNLFADGNVSVKKDGETSINAATSMGLDNLKIKDLRSNNPLFSLNRFMLDDLRADVNARKITVASVSLVKPDLAVSLSEKKLLNLAGMMKEKEEIKDAEPSEQKPSSSDPWKYEIDKVSLNNGTLLFSDKSVKPEYKTGMYNMALSIDKIGSLTKAPSPFSFKADIDKYAPFTLTGTLDPIRLQPGFAFKSTLKGLEMTHLSPYSGVYIGNYLKSGKLSLDLDYSLHDRKLKGDNNINAKNLYLGEKVAVEPVINAPVGLGLALLRDISGVIDLDVNISGDLDDPDFSVAGIIIKTLVNILVKAAASPFKLLGSLIPGGGDDMGNILFDPGSSILNQAGKDNLVKLADALNQRPQLTLSIKGNASRSEDVAALKTANLNKMVADRRGIELSMIEDKLKSQELWMVTENHVTLKAINNEMGLPGVDERLKMNIQGEDPEKGQKSAQGSETQVKDNSVYKEIYDGILKALTISDDKLISLADERVLAIKQYLVDEVKFTHERISVIKTSSSDLTGTIINMGIDAM